MRNTAFPSWFPSSGYCFVCEHIFLFIFCFIKRQLYFVDWAQLFDQLRFCRYTGKTMHLMKIQILLWFKSPPPSPPQLSVDSVSLLPTVQFPPMLIICPNCSPRPTMLDPYGPDHPYMSAVSTPPTRKPIKSQMQHKRSKKILQGFSPTLRGNVSYNLWAAATKMKKRAKNKEFLTNPFSIACQHCSALV